MSGWHTKNVSNKRISFWAVGTQVAEARAALSKTFEFSLNSKPILAQFAKLDQIAKLVQLAYLAQFGKFF